MLACAGHHIPNKKAHQLVGQCETRRHSSRSDLLLTALGRILVTQRFACPTHWWASCLNFDNRQPEVVSDVISGMSVKDVGMDACGNFGDSRLKLSEASFLAGFLTSITSDRK